MSSGDSTRVYIDGEIYQAKDAKISVFDHGLLYGDGVFEGIRIYNGRIFRWEEHLERLFESAKAILLDIPLSREEMTDALVRTARATGIREGYVRLVVTRGEGDLGIDPRKCPKPSVIIIVGGITLYPPECYEKGLSTVIVATRRNLPAACPPSVKSLNYLNNVLAKMELNRQGQLEGIMLNQEGYVSECTGDNIFIVRHGELLTPSPHCGCLVGITRAAVMELAAKHGIPCRETTLLPQDLYIAHEAFLTGTAAELVPVTSVDGRVIGDGKPGPITKKLGAEFIALRQSEGYPIYE